MKRAGALLAAMALVVGGCDRAPEHMGEGTLPPPPGWEEVQTVADRVQALQGFDGPESVRYDREQDVWFVSNFGGDSSTRDANGFVSRVDAETGALEAQRFAVGTAAAPLHAPRGMAITGDTLWVVDVDGVHAFHRRTGDALRFADLTGFEPGFLNDVTPAPDGALYVTDTGRSAVYRILGEEVEEVLRGDELGSPNGITFDSARGSLVTVPWAAGHRARIWRPGAAVTQPWGPRTPGLLDGIEPVGRRLLLASQSDSSLHLLDAGGTRRVVRVAGAPADIGIDTRRWRVAVPYVDLDRVDVWQLPGG